MINSSSLLVFPIDPLPDFLSDHTLTGKEAPERLREHAARWVQLVGSFWEWHDRATFALRFHASEGRIRIYLMAHAHQAEELSRLRGEVEVLLRAHRLDTGSRGGLANQEDFLRDTILPNPVVAEIRQLETRALWDAPAHFGHATRTNPEWKGVPEQDWKEPRVIYPWWGPGGPFLLPMESLLSQPVPVSLTVYLAPTELSKLEWDWLALMACKAMSKGEQTVQSLAAGAGSREVDPSARLAGRLYMANLRRLSATPFLVAVHCAAANQRRDVALSLASAIQALVHEPAFERPQQEDDRLPSGAQITFPEKAKDTGGFQALAQAQYDSLCFAPPPAGDPLGRLAYLVDAQGAATVFRLPVSVRGGVPGVRVRQLSPDFHPGARLKSCPEDHIELGEYHSGGGAYAPLRDLTKHALITGFTGSGKTVTVLQLLHQLWEKKVPFLVLESAKQEYRGLMGVEALRKDLRIYTLGNETCVPLRLNPFELLPGVRVEAHLGKLQTCIEGAIPPVGPSSSVISEALLLTYEQAGWRLTDSYPLHGESERQFPVLRDFVAKVDEVISRRGYAGEVESNVRAALVGRFQPLLIGSKGNMFDAQRSTPSAKELFQRPVILEMNDLIIEDKALMVMFILTLLREYRELDKSTDGSLKHVTMVEEAHNVLEDVGSSGGGEASGTADTRYKAVQAFCGLLTEIRALGEGLIIADQSPMKLARDAMRNTNLQIAHQLRDGHDRDAIANAMIMEEEQRDFLGKLPPGHAAMFRTGLEKATFIKVPPYYPSGSDWAREPADKATEAWKAWREEFRGFGYDPKVTDADVQRFMEEAEPGIREVRKLSLPFAECRLCSSQCSYRDRMFTLAQRPEIQESIFAWRNVQPEENQSEEAYLGAKWRLAAENGFRVVETIGEAAHADAAWCLFVHSLERTMQVDGATKSVSLTEYHREFFDAVVAGRVG